MRQLTLIATTLSLLVASGCTHRSDEKLTALAETSINDLRGGQLSEALKSAERGLALTQDSPVSQFAFRFRLLKAEILILQGQVAAARLILELPIPDAMAYRALAARQRYLIGKALQVLKNSTEAVTMLEDARRLAEAASAVDVVADSEDLLGQINLLSDRYDAARTVLRQALVRAETSHDRYRVAKILTDLGMVELRRGSYEEALSYFERAILYSDLRATAVYAVALHNAGICYSRLGEFKRALQVQQDSISVFENGGLKGYLERTLGDMGNTYVLMGDSVRGAEYLARAASVARAADLTSDAALWTGNLAAAYIDAAAWDKAEWANQEAHLFLETADASSLPRGALEINNLLNTARIAEGKGGHRHAAAIYGAVLAAAKGDPVFSWEAHQGLANVALALGEPAEAARHFEAALALIEKTQAGLLKTDYQLSFLARLVRFYQEYVDALVSQGAFERALEVADSGRARVLAEREGNGAPVARRVRTGEYRKLAKATGSVLLFYWLGPTRSYVWSITANEIRCQALPPAAVLAAAVAGYRQFIEELVADPLTADRSPGDLLYEQLIRPVSGVIPKGSSVIVVPDGALHDLNFESLPSRTGGAHYWIEDVTVTIAPSLGLLTEARRVRVQRQASLLLIGDPVTNDSEFPRLLHAGSEISAVQRAVGSEHTVTYRGAEATPESYRNARPEQFSMIHFVAHAAVNRESPLDSAVVLSSADGRYKLSARDIIKQKIDANLVTIAACRSAGTRTYAGEGLVGIAWAFLRAGAANVIAGLWDVDDRSTARLVETLYVRLSAGERPAVALRQAKLALLHSGKNFVKPYYWAPFQIYTLAR